MRPLVRIVVLSSIGCFGVFDPAAAQPKAPPVATATASSNALAQPSAITARTLEGASESVTGVLESFELNRRLAWVDEDATSTAFAGTTHGTLKAAIRIDSPEGDAEAVAAPLTRMSASDPQLGRPPLVLLHARGMQFRGVVEAIGLRCAAARCDATLTLRETQIAKLRNADDPTRSPGF
jgi:hypothetical protein